MQRTCFKPDLQPVEQIVEESTFCSYECRSFYFQVYDKFPHIRIREISPRRSRCIPSEDRVNQRKTKKSMTIPSYELCLSQHSQILRRCGGTPFSLIPSQVATVLEVLYITPGVVVDCATRDAYMVITGD